jgi:hypothetical protein
MIRCKEASRLLELARVLVRLDHVASFIVNANHSVVLAGENLLTGKTCARRRTQILSEIGVRAAIRRDVHPYALPPSRAQLGLLH